MQMTLIMTVISVLFLALFVGLLSLIVCALLKRALGEALREHRVRCKMTQEFVAEAVGVSRQAVSKWENGASDPSTSNLCMLAKLYGVPPEELLRAAE